jgi:hypothetical protein
MRTLLLGLSLLLLGIYHANGRPHPEVDCIPAPYVAWAMLRDASLDLRDFPDLIPYRGTCVRAAPDGSVRSRYPIGSALAMLPFVAPLAVLQHDPPSLAVMFVLGKLAGACFTVAATVLVFLICREVAPAGRWPATILFGLGTCLCSVASQAIWMHGPATFWLCLALWTLTRPRDLSPTVGVLVGLALGLAVATRPTTAFFAAATGLLFLLQRRWRLALSVAVGGAVPIGIFCLINWYHFGNLIMGGYAPEYNFLGSPLWLGLLGLLIAPSRGVLVYSPALLLVPLGLGTLGRRPEEATPVRPLLLSWLFAAGATLVYYASWHDWRGGWCYGPRFLCETMPILCVAFSAAFGQLRPSWSRYSAAGLVALSVAVHLVGLFGYSGYEEWQRRHTWDNRGFCFFELHDTQIEAHTRATFRKILGKRTDHF